MPDLFPLMTKCWTNVACPGWQEQLPDVNVLFNRRNDEREVFAVVRLQKDRGRMEWSSPWVKASYWHINFLEMFSLHALRDTMLCIRHH